MLPFMKVPSQAVLNPLSVLQIVLYIVLLFWSDLPVHGIPSWIERMLATKLGIRMSNIHEEVSIQMKSLPSVQQSHTHDCRFD